MADVGIVFDTRSDYPPNYVENRYDFISLSEVSYVKREFEKVGLTCEIIGNGGELRKRIKEGSLNCDCVFNGFEGIGSRNRESIIPSVLEFFGIPYIGSDPYALSICLHKPHASRLASLRGIPVPRSILYRGQNMDEFLESIKSCIFPVVLKPAYEGTSSGLTLCKDASAVAEHAHRLFHFYNQYILCEEYISGSEIAVPVIQVPSGILPLGPVKFTDLEGGDIALYTTELKEFGDVICADTNFPETVDQKLRVYAETLFEEFGCRDLCRFDFRVTHEGEPYFLEATPLPTLSNDGSFAFCGEKLGMTMSDILLVFYQAAIERFEKNGVGLTH